MFNKKIIINNKFLEVFIFEKKKKIINIIKHYANVPKKKIILTKFIILDMHNNLKIWRLIKGYPINGQSTHTNSSTSKKNNFFYKFRLKQFEQWFGKKRKELLPNLVQAEYITRLWKLIWFREWYEAKYNLLRNANKKVRTVHFDLKNLARGQVNGFTRVGAASKIGKAKKIKTGSLGVDPGFTKNLLLKKITKEFPYQLNIHIEKTIKKKNKKKKNKNKNKKKIKKK